MRWEWLFGVIRIIRVLLWSERLYAQCENSYNYSGVMRLGLVNQGSMVAEIAIWA